MFDAFLHSFELLLRVDTFVYITVGVGLGILVGALPGLTTTLAVALLLPITFNLDPLLGIPFLVGVSKGGVYGGSISAILVGIPGTGSAIATTFDGPALTRLGKGRKALEMALFASVSGDFIASILTLALMGPIAILTLRIGPPEVFAIILFSLVLISSVSSKSGIKGAIAAFLGLGLGFIGTDATTGATRMTFGLSALTGGIPLIPLIIGVFAVPEIFAAVESKAARFIDAHVDMSKVGGRLTWREFRGSVRTILRSTLIGSGIGMVPGVGQVVSAFVGYSAAMRASKHPETFGKGELDGIAAPEAANNACNVPALVPLMTLGIPGDNVTAILLGAFVANGLRPGPQIFQEQGALMYALLLSFVLANLIFLVLGYFLLKPFARVMGLKKTFLLPVILTLAFVGTLSTGDVSDVGIMIIVGIFAYILKKADFDLAPLIIAFVLADPIEYTLSQSLIYAHGAPYHYLFVERPIASVLLNAALIWVAVIAARPLLRRLFAGAMRPRA